MASSGQTSELQSLTALVKTLTNVQMKDILRSEFMPVSGVKTTLQLRIIDCKWRRFTIFLFDLRALLICTVFLTQISKECTRAVRWIATKTSKDSYALSPTGHFRLLPPPHTTISLPTALQNKHKLGNLRGQQCLLSLFQMVSFILRWTGKVRGR